MNNAHGITREFEAALCEYTGAPYAVVVNSCTMALTLAVARALHGKYWTRPNAWREDCEPAVSVPERTYVSVPMAIIHAGGRPVFRSEEWLGCYQLKPLPVWDCARMFTSGMYGDHDIEHGPGTMQCVSFHASKILGDTQGGAILHDDPEADAWLRRARFDGRKEGVAPKDDHDLIVGWHCYISPDVSARLLNKLCVLPKHNEPLPNDDYPDLSTLRCFK
jgi:dTDP-4-amino-4,6-dideoxygalactose transaminase